MTFPEMAEVISAEIVAHWSSINQSSIELDWFQVPADQRGKGLGGSLYVKWEKSLPPNVERITLFAADSNGKGNSDVFWEKMGFSWIYSANGDDDIDYVSLHRMQKGVNGHATPSALAWESESPESERPSHESFPDAASAQLGCP